jgi:membrane fusion protein (multidrug efflux system)
VPQQAVTRGTSGDTVTVVAPDGTFAVRQVKVGTAQDRQWLIQDGLKPGETVIVDGFQKLRGAKTVKPVPWTPPQTAGRPAGASAGASAPVAAPATASAPASGASR